MIPLSSIHSLARGEGVAMVYSRVALGLMLIVLLLLSSVSKADGGIILVPTSVLQAVCVTESEAADLDGDGLIDMIAMNVPVTGTKLLYIYPGTAPGEWASMPIVFSLAAQTQPWGLEIGDVNLDGVLDIITGDLFNATIVCLLGSGNFNYSTIVTSLPGGGGFGLTVVDYTGDGLLDVLIPGSWGGTAVMGRGDGSGQFVADSTLSLPGGPLTIAAADIDLNGLVDLVIPYSGGGSATIGVLRAMSPGNFLPMETYPLNGNYGMDSIEVVDINHDGYPDMIHLDGFNTGIQVRLNDGSGGFGMPNVYPGGDSNPHYTASADFDQDGNVDMVLAGNTLSSQSTTIVIYKGDGSGGFTVDDTLVSADCYALNTADLNGNGKIDLLVSNGNLDYVTPYFNETDVGGGGVENDFVRADCNQDGKINIADAIGALGILFMMGGDPDCDDACDINNDSTFNIADPVALLGYLFSGGLAPAQPFPVCGPDTAPDALDCEISSICP